MRQLFVLFTLTAVFGVLMAAGVAIADPGLRRNVPAHRHFVKQPNGNMAQVGPRLCDDPNLQDAFNQFHANVHSHTLRDRDPDRRDRPGRPWPAQRPRR